MASFETVQLYLAEKFNPFCHANTWATNVFQFNDRCIYLQREKVKIVKTEIYETWVKAEGLKNKS